MRTIRIPYCSYELYAAMRDCIITNVPFALINDMYSKDESLAIFNLWDSDYIPDELSFFIMQPPLSRENKAKMSKELALFEEPLEEIKNRIKAQRKA